jgi:uncharacterized membrane protein
MSEKNSIVAIFASHNDAENAVRELQKSGFDMKKLSIVGKDYHTDEHVVGYYNTGDRMMYWGKLGAFWGGLWGMLFGSAFFFVPGVGPLVVAGPLVTWIVGALEGAAVMGGLSALGAALVSIGIPKNSVLQYEASLKSGKFLLILHGTPEEVHRAKDRLDDTQATETTVHADPVAVGA